MLSRSRFAFSTLSVATVAAGLLFSATAAQAQTAYGVNSVGSLFSFDVSSPGSISTIGVLPFVPEGIDFRPGTRQLFAIDVGPVTTQLYSVNTSTGATTPIGAGFGTVAAGLNTATAYGFDFNPKTVQLDGSIRIRLVGSNGVDLRLHSATGQIAATDTPLQYVAGGPNSGAPEVTASAYLNNRPAGSGATTLFQIDSRIDRLLTQSPPNNGTLNDVGTLGATVDVLPGGGFDIFTNPLSSDDTIGGDTGYGVFQRTDTSGGAYVLYNVNLATGQLTGGALVGGGAGVNFAGGFAVVPEPSSFLLGAAGLAALALIARRRRR